jgi:hypothetical protein
MSAQDEFFKKAKTDGMEISIPAKAAPAKQVTSVSLVVIALCCIAGLVIYFYERHEREVAREKQAMEESERRYQETRRRVQEFLGER